MELKKRKQLRLKDYDYSSNGGYFITICTHEKRHLFCDIKNGIVCLNKMGCVVEQNIQKLNTLYDGIYVEKYVIMPNHVHMIVMVCRERIVCVPSPPNDPTKSKVPKMIQSFKASVTKQIRYGAEERNAYNAFPTPIWQSHFYDRIIRSELDYQEIWQYIHTNPLQWESDEFYSN